MNKINNYLVPNVLVRTSDGERSYDLESRLLSDRIIFLKGEVEDGMASICCEELLHLNNEDSTKPIHLYIMGPGGSIHSGLAIIDTMKLIDAPVYTYAIGYVASMDAAIFSAGDKRYLLPNSQVMVHQLGSGCEGKLHDLSVSVNYDKRLNNLLLGMIGRNCGKFTDKEFNLIRDTIDEMSDDNEDAVMVLPKALAKKLSDFKKSIDRDTWLMPKAAIRFGIADEILTKRETEVI